MTDARWEAAAKLTVQLWLAPHHQGYPSHDDELIEKIATALQSAFDAGEKKWKDAVIDALVVDYIYQNEHETDPRKALNDLLAWEQKIALDPAVSEDAKKLYDAGHAAGVLAERERLGQRLLATPTASIRPTLVEAPCLWCGYNGGGYWQSKTHRPECPWFTVGGREDRMDALPAALRARET